MTDAELQQARAEIRRLTERLRLAETVCTIFGWTAAGWETDREKAVTQAWMNWTHAYGSTAPTPEWNALVAELAAERDRIRAETLARIRTEASA